MEIDPGDTLEQARNAVKDKKYSVALEKYQWFFEHSVQIKQSYYGVRLSYCLADWAELAEDYSPAKIALIAERDKALTKFRETKSRPLFHDYSSISHYLKEDVEVYKQFLTIHETDKALAKSLFTFVYDYCAENKKWEICREYLGNGYKKYQDALETFDHMIEFSEKRKESGGESLRHEAADYLKTKSLWILEMLHHTNATEDYNSAISKIESDLKKRGFEYILEKILDNTTEKRK